MAEVLVTYGDTLEGSDGRGYTVRACGSEMDDSRWQGWLEFEPLDGGAPLRSARETTQPNRVDTAYWATGLTPVYLEGALERVLRPEPVRLPEPAPVAPAFDGPAPAYGTGHLPPGDSVLNPFSVSRKGEALLRRQLTALAPWHLVNIIRDYDLSDRTVEALETTSAPVLVETIIEGVRRREAGPAGA